MFIIRYTLSIASTATRVFAIGLPTESAAIAAFRALYGPLAHIVSIKGPRPMGSRSADLDPTTTDLCNSQR